MTKILSDREETEKFKYDRSIVYSPKTKGIPPKYYHNFITKKIFADKSFNDSQKKHKKTINSVSLSLSLAKSNTKIRNKTTIFEPSQQNTRPSSKLRRNITEIQGNSYGNFLRETLKPLKKIEEKMNCSNKHEELCRFYLDLLRRVELINFRLKKSETLSEFIEKLLIKFNIFLLDSLEIDDFHLLHEEDVGIYETFVKQLSIDYFSKH